MALTTHLSITKLEVGQKGKEATINTALDTLDTEAGRVDTIIDSLYQGELSSDPVSTGLLPGSTYYNTTSSKLKFLRQDGTTWTNVA